LERVLEVLTEFRIENAAAHARIDEHIEMRDKACDDLEEKVDELVVEMAVAKRTGARAGGKWGGSIGIFIVGIAEGLRSIFG
jgi:tetrahydromethanopterin S-methyltransferase subunit G